MSPDMGHNGNHGILANAAREVTERGLDRFPIVDSDAHHYEMQSWSSIIKYIEHPTTRRRAEEGMKLGVGRFQLVPHQLGDQQVAGRIKRRITPEDPYEGVLHEIDRFQGEMTQLGVDYSVVFPTLMLNLGLHPQSEVESAIAWAYARWITEEVLNRSETIKTMLYIPFNDPDMSLKMVETFTGKPGVVGFMVTSLRYQPVHHNRYMKFYRAVEESGLPLAFHPVYNWSERSLEQFDRFIGVHSLGFPLYNMIHLTNMVIHAIPERFPRLKFIWMECGVAWIPFLMFRLDNEYMMRPSEAPGLKKKPSEYMRDFYYTSQPLEWPDNLNHLAYIFEMIHAESQLLYASDYPHWDFDLPSRIYDLPFLTEKAKRRILGKNALELFHLPTPEKYASGEPEIAIVGDGFSPGK